MAAPTDFEQMLLEQINYARLAPQADFARYISSYDPLESSDARTDELLEFFGVVGKTLEAQVAKLDAAQPLVWNDNLNAAAQFHSGNMIKNNIMAHTIGSSTLAGRLDDADYTGFTTAGENVFGQATNPVNAHAAFMIDWGDASVGAVDGIQQALYHRKAIMNPDFREIGISVIEENDPSTANVGPFVVTQNFGSRGAMAESILVGHVRAEKDDDGFYSLGEGMGDVQVSVNGGARNVTPAAGGYQIDTEAGTQQMVFSGGDLKASAKVRVFVEAGNAKVDLVDGSHVMTSASVKLMRGTTDATALGDEDISLAGNAKGNHLVGGGGDNILRGKIGKDRLDGMDGDDNLGGGIMADVLDGGAGQDVLNGGRGRDVLTGGDGADHFVFLGRFGRDVITDISAEDTLFVRNWTLDDMKTLKQDGDDVLLVKGRNSIVFEDTELADLTADMFGLG